MPVFKGGLFGNNEVVLPYSNFMFKSEKKLKKANDDIDFVSFFPFPVIFARVLEVESGSELDGVEISFGEHSSVKMLCISGEWYDNGDPNGMG